MSTANAVTSGTGYRLAWGLDMHNLKPFEDGDTKKVFHAPRPVMMERRLDELLYSDTWSKLALHVRRSNPGLPINVVVQVGRKEKSPILFMELENGKKYRQNGVRLYEVK